MTTRTASEARAPPTIRTKSIDALPSRSAQYTKAAPTSVNVVYKHANGSAKKRACGASSIPAYLRLNFLLILFLSGVIATLVRALGKGPAQGQALSSRRTLERSAQPLESLP